MGGIRYNARTQVFAKSLPMIYVRSLKKTLELVINGQERRRRLFEVSRKLSRGLRELGFFVGNVESPIVPVFVPLGDMRVTMDWIQYLRNKGIFVTGVMYPVIPKGFMMFRIIPTANHTDEQIETTLQAFRSLREDRNLKLEMDESAVSRIYGKK